MSITKYKTGAGSLVDAKVETVQVERETESSVWIRGYRVAKESDWRMFHDTWEQAHAYLTARAEIRLTNARRQLELAQAFAGNIKGMKKPEGA